VSQLYIHPIDCIDCGACVPVCPVSAIVLQEDLPEKWAHFARINADWYADPAAIAPRDGVDCAEIPLASLP
jgi:ferredoxin